MNHGWCPGCNNQLDHLLSVWYKIERCPACGRYLGNILSIICSGHHTISHRKIYDRYPETNMGGYQTQYKQEISDWYPYGHRTISQGSLTPITEAIIFKIYCPESIRKLQDEAIQVTGRCSAPSASGLWLGSCCVNAVVSGVKKSTFKYFWEFHKVSKRGRGRMKKILRWEILSWRDFRWWRYLSWTGHKAPFWIILVPCDHDISTPPQAWGIRLGEYRQIRYFTGHSGWVKYYQWGGLAKHTELQNWLWGQQFLTESF